MEDRPRETTPAAADADEEQPPQPGPQQFLADIAGQAVLVRLNSGVDYRGTLSCIDGFLNIALEDTVECVDGEIRHRYGDCFIRGNNVTYLAKA